ncbi:MAG: PAS domain-containing sensor histidine kinase [Candidatus Krumholzibacteriia bacterium]
MTPVLLLSVALAAAFALDVLLILRLRRLAASERELTRRAEAGAALADRMRALEARLEQGIEAEEERDRLFNLSIDLLAVGGFDGFLQQINPAWVRVLGWSRDDLMGRPLLDFVHPEDRPATEAAFRRLAEGEPVDGLECRFACRDGSHRWLSWNSFPYEGRQRIFSVVRDTTAAKRAEQLLLENQDRLRALSSQLSLVEDRERRHLAEAIHDGLAQQLFALRAQVTLLKYPEKLADPRAVVEQMLDVLDETMTQARSLTFELFPPVLYEVGLAGALEWLGRAFEQRTGIACEVDTEDAEPDLPEDLRMMAYQSARELLNNVRKHAGAAGAVIRLRHENGRVHLSVHDDGQGFDPQDAEFTAPSPDGGGFGLFNLRERLRSVGGALTIAARPGQGCRVDLTFPAPPAAD